MDVKLHLAVLTLLTLIKDVHAEGDESLTIGLVTGFLSCFITVTGLCILFHIYCNVHDHKKKIETKNLSNNIDPKTLRRRREERQPPPDPVFAINENKATSTTTTSPVNYF